MLVPKLFTTLREYSKEKFFSDLIAGIVVGIVAIPLAIAFGIASGATPSQGLFTAIIAGFVIAVLGGSRVQIGGPTGAFVVIVYGIIAKYGTDGLIVATFLAGFILLVMGFARLGRVIEFIPYPVTVGFTSGIAVIIFSSQAKDFFGLNIDKIPPAFIEKWEIIAANIHSLNYHSLIIAVATVLIISFWPRVSRKIPGSLVAIVLFSLCVQVFQWPVETIGSRFGDLPRVLPAPRIPPIDLEIIKKMIGPAFVIALLGGIESLLSAVVADGMIGTRHRSNMELVAQGLANVSSAVFGGIPATGAVARTVTNIKNGARTPVAGVVHSITILVALLFFGQYVRLIPFAVLAGILVVVSYNMSEWRSFVSILRGDRNDVLVLLATFLVTIFFDLVIAIELGMVLSAFLLMYRLSNVTQIRSIDGTNEESDDSFSKFKIPDDCQFYEINGPFFFGVSHKFEEAMRVISKKPRLRILRLAHVPFLDSTAIRSLQQFYHHCQRSHISLILSGLEPQPLKALKESGLYELIGQQNVIGNMKNTIQRAEEILKQK